MEPETRSDRDRNLDKALRLVIVAVLLAVVATSSFFGGVLFQRFVERGVIPPVPPMSREGDLGDTVDEVRVLLEGGALEPSNESSMTYGAVQGLLQSLGDRYAQYFDERHYTYFSEQNAGEFGGIGVTLQQTDGRTFVVEVFPDTPAAKAGIEAGDVFYGIDGDRRDSWDSDAVVGRVRGKVGTTVTIEMKRKGEDEPLRFTIVRALIDIPNVESRMIGSDVGWVALANFNEKTAEDLAEALKSLEGEGARGFVLDLRDNPGGMLSEAVDVTSLFVPDGVVVSVEYRSRPTQEYRANGRRLTDKPLVVLVNGNSASASEIVAGALQDHGRAKLVGVKTFGKGSVQTVEELAAGGAVKFTIAHYLTPKKRAIDGVGLEPDVKVEMKPELAADEKTDTQLRRALEVLRAAL